MKTIHAPDTLNAYADSLLGLAQSHPLAVWIIGIVLTAAFATWAANRI